MAIEQYFEIKKGCKMYKEYFAYLEASEKTSQKIWDAVTGFFYG